MTLAGGLLMKPPDSSSASRSVLMAVWPYRRWIWSSARTPKRTRARKTRMSSGCRSRSVMTWAKCFSNPVQTRRERSPRREELRSRVLRGWFDDLDSRDGDRLGLGRRRVRDARDQGVLDSLVFEDERAQACTTRRA